MAQNEQSNFLKRYNIPSWLNVATIITVLTFIFNQGKDEQETINHRKEFQKHVLEYKNHVIDRDLHLPYKDKAILFVPRTELERIVKNLVDNQNNQNQLLNEMRKDIKDILKNR